MCERFHLLNFCSFLFLGKIRKFQMYMYTSITLLYILKGRGQQQHKGVEDAFPSIVLFFPLLSFLKDSLKIFPFFACWCQRKGAESIAEVIWREKERKEKKKKNKEINGE